jgi:hypothetical protein
MSSKIDGEKRGGASNLTNAGKGRPKGAANKNTKALKDMILTALGDAGGIDYLVKQADENPTAFMTLVGKVLPLDVNNNHNGQIVAQVVFKGLNANG